MGQSLYRHARQQSFVSEDSAGWRSFVKVTESFSTT